MIIHVVAFARMKEEIGSDRFEVHVPDDAAVSDLKLALLNRFPNIETWLSRCSISVDQEYSLDDTPLKDGCEVGLIPPVSGG